MDESDRIGFGFGMDDDDVDANTPTRHLSMSKCAREIVYYFFS